jgi:probable phosphoglycerate mutase
VQLLLVRHALPERVDPGRVDPTDGVRAADAEPSGPADPGLTPQGWRQAERLVGLLGPGSGVPVEAVCTSPMARARATAAPLADALGLEPVVLDDLVEYDADSARYVPVHEMARLDPAAWRRMQGGLLPEHVDVTAFTDRVEAALERVVAAHPGRGTVVVVAHAGVLGCWLARLLGISRPLVFPLDYTGVTRVLAARDGRRVVRSVNEISHVLDLLGTPS